MDDAFLVNQAKSGNKNAFKLLILRYQRIIFSFLGNFQLANQVIEDLAQETFLRAYKNISSFDAQKGVSFSTWLFTIAKTLALTERAKNTRHTEKLRGSLDKKKDIFHLNKMKNPSIPIRYILSIFFIFNKINPSVIFQR